MSPLTDGLRLALSLLTVLPVRTGKPDRRTAAWAIALAPVAGLLLGAIATGVVYALTLVHSPPLLTGLLIVGLLALLTRGMHLDGLADTADGLGCYGPPERALAVMKDGGAGPFAVVTLIVLLGAQAAGIAAGIETGRYWLVGLAVVTGRAAFTWCCRRGYPAARPEGLGALVAGTQPLAVPFGWALVLAVAGGFAIPGRWWQGVLAVGLAAAVVAGLAAHVRRRFGGLTGDVLGAACECAVTCVLIVTALGG